MDYRFQATSVYASRAVYALYWFNVAPGLADMSRDLNLTLVQLGIMTTAFYIGLALFQMVGGLLASRIGNRKTSTLGTTILGVSVIATGLSLNLPELIVSRFFAGVGSALFFSPALGLLADIVPKQKYSFHVGLFNGSFNLGAGIGVIGWNFLDQAFSWRIPLYIAGIIMILLSVENLVVLRNSEVKVQGKQVLRRARSILVMPVIWLLPVVALSAIFSETVIGQLFVYYAESGLSMSPNAASSLDMAYLIIGFAGGLAGGYIFGRSNWRLAMFVVWSLACGAVTIGIAFATGYVPLLVLMLIGGTLVVNVFSMLYTVVAESIEDRGMVSFSLSFVNFLQVVIGSASPVIFSVVHDFSGYMVAWTVLGTAGIVSVVAAIPMNRIRGRVSPSTAPAK